MIETSQAIEAALDNLLITWHTWASSDRGVNGYPKEAAGMKMFRASRQYDYENGSIDADVDSSIAEAVDFAVSQMPDPYRTAIHCNAKNLTTGVSVWRSPRLPAGDIERAQVAADAREMLTKTLVRGGLL